MSTSVIRTISPICRLSTLLLILLVCFVDAIKLPSYSRFPEPSNTNLQGSGDVSIVRRCVLYNRCTAKFVRIRKTGKKGVDALGTSRGEPYTTLNIKSVGAGGKVIIQGEDSGLYLCFNRNAKLRARHRVKEFCEFYHNITKGYDQFNLALNTRWYVGFKGRGKRKRIGRPLPGYRKVLGSRMESCFDFILLEAEERPVTTTYGPPMGPFDFDKSDFDPEKPPEPKLIDTLRSRHPRIRHSHRKSRRRKNRRKSRKRKKDRTNR